MTTITANAISSAADPEEDRCELPVQGMTCASCVRRVERALKATPGVHDAHVNFVTGRANITYDRTGTTPEILARAIEAAGYGYEPGKANPAALADAVRAVCP